ncbi:biopolymer transporter ExbD [Rhodobacter sp. KR11]|uniref:biopolymer transporter ExbD n=1 Tax=Rhodobacter sp. KR11 TaxID=2974588 RepID=UPI0022236078|nr:biopolymer transporter ExbD [Rhodobacter sp. KR11]MCW1920321.1 biopolymer transporter ExbD [Rhodobacter sp. KR11]
MTPLNEDPDELADINVTPFIDVMLVLLIVFMVAAPLSTVDVPVNLPASKATATQRPQDPVWVTLTETGYMLNDTAVTAEALAAALDTSTGAKRDTALYLRADRDLTYARLMQGLDGLRAAGYLNVALVGLEAAP